MSELKHFPPSEGDLHAYVDGSLTPSERARVELYLTANPEVAERLLAYRQQRLSLTALLDSLPLDPEPSSLIRLQGSLAKALRRQKTFRRTALVGVSAAAVLAMFSFGWVARDYYGPAESHLVSLTNQAADAHLLFTGEPELPGLTSADNGRSVFEWLVHRTTGRTLNPPDLATVGFKLVNGWLVSTRKGPAVQLLYQDDDGHPLTFYAISDGETSSTSFSFATEQDLSIFYWQTAGVSYSIAARLERKKLLSIAERINKELETALKKGLAPKSDAEPSDAGKDEAQEASATAPAATQKAPDSGDDGTAEKKPTAAQHPEKAPPRDGPSRDDEDEVAPQTPSQDPDVQSGTFTIRRTA